MTNSDLEQQIASINPDWSICTGGGRCFDPGGIYDSDLDQHVMSSDELKTLTSLITKLVKEAKMDELKEMQKHPHWDADDYGNYVGRRIYKLERES